MNTMTKSKDLVAKLLKEKGSSRVTETPLMTNEKVLARITDGIYRAPGSSLRELLSNAYDADATTVTVNSDAPRFKRIIVRDNGRGMSLETLAHVVQNIGGSAKRTEAGKRLNVTNEEDSNLSPGGRKLIGKIGIGLFSVAHLSHHFKIVTKVAGEDYRAHAEVILAQYKEGENAEGIYQQGKVRIWSEPEAAESAQGTEITILDLKPSAVAILRSREIWSQLQEQANVGRAAPGVVAPAFHIGEVSHETGDTIETTANLPWDNSQSPSEKFKRLVAQVIERAKQYPSEPPDLERMLDNYLQTLWMLGLALPLPYVDRGPFRYTSQDDIGAYVLSNSSKGQATALDLKHGSVGSAAKISQHEYGADFCVDVDGVQLSRPIDVLALPTTSNAIKRPQVFVGQFRPDLSKIPEAYRGGDLAISAYFAWAPKMIPSDHQGVLIRINGASGALFDNTFLRYKVAERTRLTQIAGEVFVDVGLDAALNIDRESFNYTHPHYVIVQNWIHNALRQITNQLKDLAKEKLKERKTKQINAQQSALGDAISREWIAAGRGEDEEPPNVRLQSPNLRPRGEMTDVSGTHDLVILDRDVVLSHLEKRPKSQTTTADIRRTESVVESIYKILFAYRLLDAVSLETQVNVMASIARVLDAMDRK